uniref:Growth hormone secretagogue receptor type 1 n=1 Tax=Astatotilapia calliptera TaxID=8154 RepID=A0A3P8RBP2_ASTCA
MIAPTVDFFTPSCLPIVDSLFPVWLCVTVIYIPLMLFGLLGNILTILVVWLRPHMRTSTYLYLSSMAVSDLLILLLLPLDLYKLWRPRPWPLGDLACKLTMFLSECCTFCTILHITFLSLERYLAVCWPITAKTVVTRRRTRAIIGCLWLSAAVSAAPVRSFDLYFHVCLYMVTLMAVPIFHFLKQHIKKLRGGQRRLHTVVHVVRAVIGQDSIWNVGGSDLMFSSFFFRSDRLGVRLVLAAVPCWSNHIFSFSGHWD